MFTQYHPGLLKCFGRKAVFINSAVVLKLI